MLLPQASSVSHKPSLTYPLSGWFDVEWVRGFDKGQPTLPQQDARSIPQGCPPLHTTLWSLGLVSSWGEDKLTSSTDFLCQSSHLNDKARDRAGTPFLGSLLPLRPELPP